MKEKGTYAYPGGLTYCYDLCLPHGLLSFGYDIAPGVG